MPEITPLIPPPSSGPVKGWAVGEVGSTKAISVISSAGEAGGPGTSQFALAEGTVTPVDLVEQTVGLA